MVEYEIILASLGIILPGEPETCTVRRSEFSSKRLECILDHHWGMEHLWMLWPSE